MAPGGRAVRIVRETVLIVGEGYAEEAFLRHLRQLYTAKSDGRSATIRNARGKGAAHVVTTTARIARQIPHTQVASLFDEDTDWTKAVADDARKRKIIAVVSDPCLEAVLLRMHGDKSQRDSAGHKRAFEQRFLGPAHDVSIYPRHFPRDVLDAARASSRQLDLLLLVLGC